MRFIALGNGALRIESLVSGNKRLATFENGKNSVLDLRKQLLDEIGVYVCLPDEKVVQDIGENEYQE